MRTSWTEESVLALIRDCFADTMAKGANLLQDDGACLPRLSKGKTRVISCDAFQESNDFLLQIAPVESSGYRAIVQNLSDLAAMGAQPVGFVWSLEVPRSWLSQNGDLLKRFCSGANEACEEFGLLMLGGDLSLSSDQFRCTVTVLGDVSGQPLSRCGAKPGDQIYVSRKLGLSSYGLQTLLERFKSRQNPMSKSDFDKFLAKLPSAEKIGVLGHLQPCPEILLGKKLVEKAGACMDISDGLAQDLHRLCKASGVGAVIDSFEYAIHEALPENQAKECALYGGEDFALLFTLKRKNAAPKGCIRVGEITNDLGLIKEICKNKVSIIKPKGYDHFTSRA